MANVTSDVANNTTSDKKVDTTADTTVDSTVETTVTTLGTIIFWLDNPVTNGWTNSAVAFIPFMDFLYLRALN